MKVVNKKVCVIIVLLLVIIESCTLFLMYKSYLSKETKLDAVNLNKEEITEMFAIMTEQKDGTYTESSDTKWPTTGYKYNEKMSGCIDLNGKKLDGVLVYDPVNKIATVDTVNTSYCYLYFDLDRSIYSKMVSVLPNSKITSISAETGETYNAYYYPGSTKNNNVLYAGFCWKMVITTETKGVKLIYNGKPTTSNGVTSCDNKTDAAVLTPSITFNQAYRAPTYVGYMYNPDKIYNYTKETFYDNVEVAKSTSGSPKDSWGNQVSYSYSDTVTYSNGSYTLVDPIVSYWNTNYSSLKGKYTCLMASSNSQTAKCATVKYTVGGNSTYEYYYEITGGKLYDDYNMKLSTSVIDNGNGTYTLENPIEITRAEYYSMYSTYKKYYICNDLISETCSDMMYTHTVYNGSFTGFNMANDYKYGNSFTYDESTGNYTLIDTDVSAIKQFWNWNANYSTLGKNHYTCFNTSGVCKNLYYIIYTFSDGAAYITLTGGKSINDALNDMLSADDVNKTDSYVKAQVDSWYRSYILNKKDSNGVLYSKYLENAIFCGNRAVSNGGAWNPDGGSTTGSLYFNYSSLECANKSDRYTLKASSGGTEGYGNNALTYPVALLSYKEASLAGGSSGNSSPYLYTGYAYMHTISPAYYGKITGNEFYGHTYGLDLSANKISSTAFLRPVVSLGLNVDIIDGDGSYTKPYQVAYAEE